MSKIIGPKSAAAIKFSIEVGRRLQEDFPEIADDYRNLMFRAEIVAKYGICEKYGMTPEIAKSSVSYAVNGHHGDSVVNGHEFPIYDGLIPDKAERDEISKRFRNVWLEYRRKNSIGIHGQSDEERRECGSEGGIAAAKAKGFIPWSKDELEKAYGFSLSMEFWNRKMYAGGYRVNNGLIAQRINDDFHDRKEVRKEFQVRIKLCKHRSKLEKEAMRGNG